MKRMDLFCASPASTAICSSMDQRAIVQHRTRTVNRHSNLSGDIKKALNTAPCISQFPLDPKPFSNYQKGRKSSAKQSDQMRRKSSANVNDVASLPPPPPSSSTYLLNDNPIFEILSDKNNEKALVPIQKTRSPRLSYESSDSTSLALVSSSTRTRSSPIRSDNSLSLKSSSARSLSSQITSSDDSPSLKSLTTRSRSRDQVVILRVSIHCKGCEGKLRKHISRMEGVKSFSIDLDSKKVTVIGDVTPQGVLTSVARVKNAQFWPSPASSSSSSTPRLAY